MPDLTCLEVTLPQMWVEIDRDAAMIGRIRALIWRRGQVTMIMKWVTQGEPQGGEREHLWRDRVWPR